MSRARFAGARLGRFKVNLHSQASAWGRQSIYRGKSKDLDGQIKWLVAQMTDDLEVWKTLTSSHDIDMFCGAFMQSGNDGLLISAETMLALGSRGTKLDLCS
jgi:hypothetical protein